jgi:hypothetical protein
MRAVLAILVALIALPADAGPWPRERRTGFLSIQQEFGAWATGRPDLVTRLYAEYGLGRGWTLGLDGSLPVAGRGTPQGLVFLRFSTETRFGWLAVEAGAGAHGWPATGVEPLLRPALHWGMGTGGRWPGWTSVRLAAEIRPATGAVLWKADTMAGLRPTDRLALMLGSELAVNGQGYGGVNLVPGLAFRLSPKFEIVAGVRVPLHDPATATVQAGTWIRF